MAWYRTGTVAVTSGSKTVTGTSTAWVGNVQPGDAFVGPDGAYNEVDQVVSNTGILLVENYGGTTASGAAYKIIPTQGRVRDMATAVLQLISDYGTVESALTVSGANVGIGRAPTAQLDVLGGMKWAAGKGFMTAYNLGGSLANSTAIDSDDKPFALTRNGGTLSLGIDINGNVGFGVEPSYKLDMGAASSNAKARVGGVLIGNAGSGYPSVGYNAAQSGASAWNYDITDAASWVHFASPQITFYRAGTGTGGAGITPLKSMQIDGSGNLGIGRTPGAGVRLDVEDTKAIARMTSSTGTNAAYFNITNSGGNFYFGVDSSVGGDFAEAYAGVIWHGGSHPLAFGTSNLLRMVLDAAGNLRLRLQSAAPTLTADGEFNIIKISNTVVRFRMRGSDGVTRSYDMTLAP